MAGEKERAWQADLTERRVTAERRPEHACACMALRDRNTWRTLAG
ncbi:hypothetical protein LIG30_1865 [Burkholderia sp. lig30]|jgi:hypothetical protein|nr:hypothetical protein LIG30_1865 [Burkholderia sp. lig30]